MHLRITPIQIAAAAASILLACLPPAVAEPPKIVKDHGLFEWRQNILEMATDLRLMCVAAHPDDEDSETLAYYNRGFGVRTSILLANWGEGGQNEIGSELYEELGVIRSKETLEAADLLGTRVYSINQVDFGFSKTLEETWEFWDRDEALEKTVRVLRLERPHVIITNHRVGKGHGNHQAVAQLIEAAIPLAASSEVFTHHFEEGLDPWTVERLYQRRRHHEGEPGEDYDVQIPVGTMDPMRGLSYQEIAGEALLRHRSQGAKGIWQWINARRIQSPFTYFYLIVGDPPLGPFEDLFDGMEGGWWTREGWEPFAHEGLLSATPTHEEAKRNALQKAARLLRPDLREVESSLVEAIEALKALPAEVDRPSNWLPEGAKDGIGASSEEIGRYQTKVVDRMLGLGEEQQRLESLLTSIWGVKSDLNFSEKKPFPGQELEIEILLTNQGKTPLAVHHYRLDLPKGWKSAPAALEIGEIPPLATARAAFWVQSPTDAEITVPEVKELYREQTPWLPNVRGVALLSKDGVESQAHSEGRIEVSPAWELWISPEESLIPIGSDREIAFSIETRRHQEVDSPSPLNVTLPDGKTRETEIRPTPARRSSTTLRWSPPSDLKPGDYDLRAELRSGDRVYAASASLRLAEVKVVEGLSVGVVQSYDDTLPRALDMLGVDYTLLTENDVRSGDLSGFDSILIDIRGYLERPDLLESNGRFLNYCSQGGNLVVFYHKSFEWNDQVPPLSPLPLRLSNNRITDENAPVQILKKDHPLVTAPNRIGPSDWEGWIQERGLYFPDEYDSRFEEILAVTDPGEAPLKSSLLAAKVGEGTYIYTSLVFYRQLKARTPGAYRLFANLISYGAD